MNLRTSCTLAGVFQLLPFLVAGLLISSPRIAAAEPKNSLSVARTSHHGWHQCMIIGNGRVEAVIVPEIGRVMQFRFVGKESPFWENRLLDSKKPQPEAKDWWNFGGDKTWPSPQEDWGKVTSRGWPPPQAFDSMPVEARLENNSVVLVSAIDPHYGIRTYRKITLDPAKPVMRIKTTYEKVEGKPKKVGVWIISQLAEPEAVFSLVPLKSAFPLGYNKQSGEVLPLGLKVQDRYLSLRRDPLKSTKIGMDSDNLLWIGKTQALLIESKRVKGTYPDQGSSSEIYTNPDPLPYVELEMLGPLHEMKVGSKIEQTNVYTLFERSKPTASEEAHAILTGAR